jgi:hypothetical protein
VPSFSSSLSLSPLFLLFSLTLVKGSSHVLVDNEHMHLAWTRRLGD